MGDQSIIVCLRLTEEDFERIARGGTLSGRFVSGAIVVECHGCREAIGISQSGRTVMRETSATALCTECAAEWLEQREEAQFIRHPAQRQNTLVSGTMEELAEAMWRRRLQA